MGRVVGSVDKAGPRETGGYRYVELGDGGRGAVCEIGISLAYD